MVKHIVLFKLKDEAPADKKLTAMKEFKAAIEALPAKISVIRKIEVGLNMNPGETWSIALYSEFDTLDDVKFYATHPEHVAAGKLIAEATVKMLGGNPSPYLVTAVLFCLAVLLTQFMSNTASKALLCPVGIALSAQMGASPKAVLMAILIASSCAFASPVGTPPNTLVLGPGNYKFLDYVKAGSGLVFVCLIVSIIVIPVVWPFFPQS